MNGTAVESPARVELPGGALAYTLRRSPRARRLRVVVDLRRGVVVTVPLRRRPFGSADPAVERFLREREAWLRRHLERQARARARVAVDLGLDGGLAGPLGAAPVLLYRGEPHRVRIEPAPASVRRSTVSREGADDVDELIVRLAARDRRPPEAVLRAWLGERARVAVERAIDRFAPGLEVTPAAVTLRDQRTRWGSASRPGRLSFSWRLVLAPPDALETVVVHELAHLRVFGHGPAFWALVASLRPDHVRWRRWLREHSLELHATLSDRDGRP